VRDLASSAVAGEQSIHEATLSVTDAGPETPTRLRVVRDALQVRILAGENWGYTVDSRALDEEVFEVPQLAALVRPQLALLGVPAEFRLGAGGRVAKVDGAERWNELFLEALERTDPRLVLQAANAPTAELLAEEWSWYLFPPLGADPIGPDDAREVVLLRDTFCAGSVETRFAVRATHLDEERGILRLEGVATPKWLPRQGPPRSNSERSVEAGQVVTSADSSRAIWEIDQKRGLLRTAWYAEKHRLDVGFITGRAPVTGEKSYSPQHMEIERRILVEPLD
jgi:hypothetical protein